MFNERFTVIHASVINHIAISDTKLAPQYLCNHGLI